MTREEFDEAAHRLLLAEREGELRLPADERGTDVDEEQIPLRSPPAHFTTPGRLPGDQGPAAAPRRTRPKRSSRGDTEV